MFVFSEEDIYVGGCSYDPYNTDFATIPDNYSAFVVLALHGRF